MSVKSIRQYKILLKISELTVIQYCNCSGGMAYIATKVKSYPEPAENAEVKTVWQKWSQGGPLQK